MEKELKQFLKELKFNEIINKQKGIENRIDMDYVIERITEILNKEGIKMNEIFNKDNLSNDKKEILVDSIKFYKNEVLKANGNNLNSFTITFLNELLEELKEVK